MNTQIKEEVRKIPFYINRNFGLLWQGQIISNIGDTFFDTTLTLWITTVLARNQQWVPLAVSGVFFAIALPTLIVGPFTGVFVDRWEKRRTLLMMDAIRALLITLLLLTTLPLPFLPGGQMPKFVQLSLVYIIVAFATSCAQFFNPARLAFMGNIVDRVHLTRASGLGQTSINLSFIIGPPLAAPLFFALGVQWAFLINIVSFLVSFLAILGIRVPKSDKSVLSTNQRNFWRDFTAGLVFFKQSRILLTILISLSLTYFGSTALNTLGVFFAARNLRIPLNLYGTLNMAFGIGSLLGALVSTVLVQRIGLIRSIWGSLLLLGTLLFIYSRLTIYPLALFIMLLIGLPIAAFSIAFNPLVLRSTPKDLVGRVISVFYPCTSLVAMVSAATTGYLASTQLHNLHANFLGITLGPIDTILSATAILVFIGGIYALISLRDVHIEAEKPESVLHTTP